MNDDPSDTNDATRPLRPDDLRSEADVRAWLAGLDPDERAALERTWALAARARGAPPPSDASAAALLRVWAAIDGGEPSDRAGRPARARPARLRRVGAAGVLVAALAVGFVAGRWAPGAGGPTAAPETAEFLFLLRGGHDEARTPDEQQAVVTAFTDWARELNAAGRLRAGDELTLDGRVLRAAEGGVNASRYRLDADGIGGYFIIAARDYEDAVAVARECPQFRLGGTVEVRQIVRR